jgi:predicted oxidoreductase
MQFINEISLGSSRLRVSRLAYGCWRIAQTDELARTTGRAALLAAIDAGYTFFDHADIYCRGRSEELFGRVLGEVAGLRDRVVIASKCGVCLADTPATGAPYRYDLSAEYIVESCEGSLRRLGIETIDLYQLHRADWLMNPAEVAAAFTRLRQQGKVREFGVSNFRVSTCIALQRFLSFPLVTNQVEISLANLAALEDGTLDHCLSERLTPLAWSPLGGGLLADGARKLLPAQESYETSHTASALDRIAERRGVGRGTIALAWLARHPAKIVPVIGSTNPARIRDCARALEIVLTREEWYDLLQAALGSRLP